MNIASDLSILICNAWSLQKLLNLVTNCYRPVTEEEIRTTSSAKASKNNCNVAISNIIALAFVIPTVDKYYLR
jgi:hypothetical protein